MVPNLRIARQVLCLSSVVNCACVHIHTHGPHGSIRVPPSLTLRVITPRRARQLLRVECASLCTPAFSVLGGRLPLPMPSLSATKSLCPTKMPRSPAPSIALCSMRPALFGGSGRGSTRASTHRVSERKDLERGGGCGKQLSCRTSAPLFVPLSLRAFFCGVVWSLVSVVLRATAGANRYPFSSLAGKMCEV